MRKESLTRSLSQGVLYKDSWRRGSLEKKDFPQGRNLLLGKSHSGEESLARSSKGSRKTGAVAVSMLLMSVTGEVFWSL